MDGSIQPPKRQRGKGRPFVKGQVANPGGRPKRREELVLKLSEFDALAVERLRNIIEHGEDKDAVAAIKLKWSYQYGNPIQPISGENGGALQVEVDVLGMLRKLAGDGG